MINHNIFKNTTYRILELFIDNPNGQYHAREIARILRITHPTVSKRLDDLIKLDLIRKNEITLYPTYYANNESEMFKFYKKNHFLLSLFESKLIDYLKKSYPTKIILFGSCSKGTYSKDSDIDIFMECDKKKFDISRFEKKLKRKINLLFEPNIRNFSEELRVNIINGTVLLGKIGKRDES